MMKLIRKKTESVRTDRFGVEHFAGEFNEKNVT